MNFENFKIDFTSGVPIYIQLKEAIKYAIAAGYYPPGSRLPTVRQMAVSLKINANTVSRVYSELEQEGILATRQGKGTFVREVDIPKEDFRRKRLQEIIERTLVESYNLGFSPEEVLQALTEKVKAIQEEKGGEQG
ncbi:GntR family transcriptional regulator [Calderihabitans maritimus]|uniref:Putative transcriptional regulator n=1 Tax=Calderihabitans maritimus TaxID=1246530 RepID=A0A1Z5HRV7_9FIRM|nr:GntR family transcriptional regulator [Calderihabitans maritimus]GAW92055.1 putative transcriptional regulator [Calderihabitans maritimus]